MLRALVALLLGLAALLAVLASSFGLTWVNGRRKPTPASLSPRLWHVLIGPFAIVAYVVGITTAVGTYFASAPPSEASSGPTTIASTGSPSKPIRTGDSGCLVYQGRGNLAWQETYDDNDFVSSSCAKPHQFEVIERNAVTTCNDAATDAIDRGKMHYATRVLFREFGPSGCAIGRFLNGSVETDNYRISKTSSPIATFGICIPRASVDAYMSEDTYGGMHVRCARGAALTTGIGLTDEDPKSFCRDWAAKIPSTHYYSARVKLEEGDQGVKCALVLKYSDG